MEYTLKVDTNDLGVISEALALLPLGKALTVYNKLAKQIAEQDAVKTTEKPVVKK